jgi:rhodanese-related sulfurtransferase
MLKRLLVANFLLLITVSYGAASEQGIISVDELKKMVDAKKQFTIVDARTEKEFLDGHIPMAVNIPPEKLVDLSTLLPKNKNRLIIFYCRGAG